MRWLLVLGLCSASIASAETTPAISDADAKKLLYLDVVAPAACSLAPEPIVCLISARYGRDPQARAIAVALFRDHGHVAGVGEAERMDGGYRGMIRLVPELPIGTHRKHLVWVAAAMKQI